MAGKRLIGAILGFILISSYFLEADACHKGGVQTIVKTDNPPRFLSCPGDLGNMQTTTTTLTVLWKEPTAEDDTDGKITPRRHGRSPNSKFSEGSHSIIYVAKDSAGNQALCIVTFNIIVGRCPTLQHPSDGSVLCNDGTSLGSVCWYVCKDGYELNRATFRTCKESKSWTGRAAYCIEKSCSDDIRPPVNGSVTCSNGVKYQSICSYSCTEGYAIPAGQSRDRFCTSTGWTGNPPLCEDSSAPVFNTCPESRIVFAEALVNNAVVTWDEPSASDNTGEVTLPVQTKGLPSGSQFPEGYHVIEYAATDSSGLGSTCMFTIMVQVIMCRTIPVYPGLLISCPNGNIRGSECTFSCTTGYRIHGKDSMTCEKLGNVGEWSNEAPTCQIVECPFVSPPDNGDFVGGNACQRTYGSSCYFFCNAGYYIDNNVLRCTAQSGTDVAFWEGALPTCTVETCEVPSLEEGMVHKLNSTCEGEQDVDAGTECGYECQNGYTMYGPDIMTCNANGEWAGQTPVCEVVTCFSSDIPAPSNGIKSGCPNEHERFGTSCAFTCDEGYLPSQTLYRTCLDDGFGNGVWDGGPVSCTVVQCLPLEAPKDGFVHSCRLGQDDTDVTMKQDYATTCSVLCNAGYTALSATSRRCLAEGIWDGIAQRCVDVTAPVFICPSDRVIFALAGQSSAEAHWELWEPLRATDANGFITAVLTSIDSVPVSGDSRPASFSEGSHTLVYRATDAAGNTATCSFEVDVKVARCPPLYAPSHGDVTLHRGQGSCEGGAVFGSSCTITCDTGYLLEEGGLSTERHCLRTSDTATVGYWNGTQPSCEVVTCAIPDLMNGDVTGCPPIETTYQDQCQFECNDGYLSSNSEKVVKRACQANATWSGVEPQCDIIVTCPAAFRVRYGEVFPNICSLPNPVPFDTECLFQCGNGFIQYGPYVKICTADGTWNDQRTVTCNDIQSPVFDVTCPVYISENAQRRTTYANVDFEEVTATDNSGNLTITKLQTAGPGSNFYEGSTTVPYVATDVFGNTARCDVVVHINVFRCPRLLAPSYGSVHNCSDPVHGAECTFSCNTGYELIGPASRTCELTVGQAPAFWDGTQAVCRVITCEALSTQPLALKSGCVADPPQREPYGTLCSFYCPYGYQGVGESQKRCQADGTWTSTNFTCEPTSCMPLNLSSGMLVTPDVCTTQPLFGETCLLGCVSAGFRVEPDEYSVTSCLGNGLWSKGIANAACVDQEAPVFSECPYDFNAYAERGTFFANVTWSVEADDNDGSPPAVTCNEAQGLMGEGDYSVTCVAMDTQGNTATCSFEISVKIRRCSLLSPPVFGSFGGSCDNVWGSTCSVACSSGYMLIGPAQTTCEYNGVGMYWERDSVAYCDVVRCQPLGVPDTVNVYPTICSGNEKLYYGTTCSFFCRDGLTLDGNGSPVNCESDGTWDRVVNENSSMSCIDRIAPTLLTCPGPSSVTRTEVWGVEVSFEIPTASDNVDDQLDVVTTPANLTSPYNFTADTFCEYAFYDDAGNSVACSFQIYVEDAIAPVVVSCPEDMNINASQPLTEVTWDEPEFYEVTGDDLRITCNYDDNTVELPWGSHVVMYQATNTDNGKTAICQFAVIVTPVPCRRLDPPGNGALVCDGWQYGRFCSMFCNANYTIPRLSSGQNPPTIYVCGSSGFWVPHANVPDCSEIRRPDFSNLPSELLYYSGTCGDEETNQEIAENFIRIIEGSHFQDICNDNQECAIQNVGITCGPVSGFTPRLSTEGAFTRSRERHQRQKVEDASSRRVNLGANANSNLPFEYSIYWEFAINVDQDPTLSNWDAALDAEDMMIDMIDVIQGHIDNGTLPPPSVPGLDLTIVEDSLAYGYSRVECADAFISDNSDLQCSACTTGTYYSNSTSQCLPCPRGSYQDEQAMMSCKACPTGNWTAEEGATNSTECKEMCLPGTYSKTGVAPCYRCDYGFYETENLSTNCTKCPNDTTTLHKGANSTEQCLVLCQPGSYSDSGVAPCTVCPVGSYQPSQQMTTCFECPGNTTTLLTGSTSSDHCKDIDECSSQPCQHNATCLDRLESYTCLCVPGYSGLNCEVDVDECASDPCVNGATCYDGLDFYECHCFPGFSGEACDLDINECLSTPCQNNATCINHIPLYKCICAEGFHGQNCELELNACSPNPCVNGATCQHFPGDAIGYICECLPGFGGYNCSRNIDECGSNPCQHGGVCSDQIDGFTCECPSGYEGVTCEADIDLCANSTCQNNGTCVDVGTKALCSCPAQYAGDRCDRLKNICDGGPCKNGGNCTLVGNTEYTCACPAGFAGKDCEIVMDACSSDPCSNDASCYTDPNGDLACVCAPGFTGTLCEEELDECLSQPCGMNGTCLDNVASYQCLCADGWEGSHCTVQKDYCSSAHPCENGGTCVNEVVGYVCLCTAGFKGIDCEVETDECSSDPCLNGGTCQGSQGAYICLCLPGFTGENCEVNIDECESTPCLNNGTCVDGVDLYRCVCETGYSGDQCEQIIYPCQDQPCMNGATCSHLKPGFYRCFCPEGYTGQNCEVDLDECNSYPCFNAERCVDGQNSYTCECKEGYSGVHCEVDIDECAAAPCLNNATCLNQPGNFSCACLPGYQGLFCENNVDECASQPCRNGGTCDDEVNGYSCTCTPEFGGDFCQVVVAPECLPNPCTNGATCRGSGDGAGYDCDCLAGFTGSLCEENINECIGNQCTNNATCVDKVNGYSCRCNPGYEGIFCEINSDDCSPNMCENNAQCVDLLDGFICECLEGFTGTLCQINVDECESTPCQNGGSCLDEANSFFCDCTPGFSGPMCDINEDDCAGEPCLNGGVCTDGLTSFACTCAPGFTGVLCENVLPSNYDFIFTEMYPSVRRQHILSGAPSSLIVSLWLRTVSAPSELSLFRLEDSTTPAVVAIENPCSIRVVFTSRAENTDWNLCDYKWHHVFYTWELNTNGSWMLWIDGQVAGNGTDAASLTFEETLMIGASQLDAEHIIFVSVFNVWGRHLNDEDRVELSTSCISSLFGDIISWTELVVEVTETNELISTSPSLCDAFDECLSNPCLFNGTCVNLPNKFTCSCREGFEGPTCGDQVDLCRENYCQNDGTCSTVEGQLRCECREGFSGEFCELKIVNGEWSTWNPWTDCSATCGGGLHARYRQCDNPEPQNGGEPCQGEADQEEACNTEECPSCLQLKSPPNVLLNCAETASLITCTIQCNHMRYDFSQSVLDEYVCGVETNFRWSHQSSLNPQGELPDCVEIEEAESFSAIFEVDYPSASCEGSTDKETIELAFLHVLSNNQEQFGCLMSGTCSIELVEVSNCDAFNTRRAARAVEDGITVALTAEQNITYGSDNNTRLFQNYTALFDNYVENFTKLVRDDKLVLCIDGIQLQPNKSSISTEAFENCPPGTVPSRQEGYCVPCEPGTYQPQQEGVPEFSCYPCPVNTYQEDAGQVECIPCPDGEVTNGEFSHNSSDCYNFTGIPDITTTDPPQTTRGSLYDNDTPVIITTVAVITGLLIVLAGFLIFYMRYCRRRAKVPETSYAMQPMGNNVGGGENNQGPSHTITPVQRPISVNGVERLMEERGSSRPAWKYGEVRQSWSPNETNKNGAAAPTIVCRSMVSLPRPEVDLIAED